MASLQYRDKSGTVHTLSGSAYDNDIVGTKKLYIRTGTNPDDKITYGVATVTSATSYSPLKLKVDGQNVAIGRKETYYTYSTNTNTSSTINNVPQTNANPSYNGNLYSTKSSPNNNLYYTSSTSTVSYSTATGNADSLPSNFPTPYGTYVSTNNSQDGVRITYRSIQNFAKYSIYKSTKAHTVSKTISQYASGSGDNYWAGKTNGPTSFSTTSGWDNVGTERFKAGYSDWYNYNWTLSSGNGNSWYYNGTGSKSHNSTNGRPWTGSGYWKISAYMVDYWSNGSGNIELGGEVDYDGYWRKITSQSIVNTKYFTINCTASIANGYAENITLTATTRNKYNYTLSSVEYIYSRTTVLTTGYASSSTTYAPAYAGTQYVSSGTNYSHNGNCANVYMTVTNTSKAYRTTTQLKITSSSKTYSTKDYAKTSTNTRYATTTTAGWPGYISYDFRYSKDISMSYTTSSRTVTAINNSTLTTADKIERLETHNFI